MCNHHSVPSGQGTSWIQESDDYSNDSGVLLVNTVSGLVIDIRLPNQDVMEHNYVRANCIGFSPAGQLLLHHADEQGGIVYSAFTAAGVLVGSLDAPALDDEPLVTWIVPWHWSPDGSAVALPSEDTSDVAVWFPGTNMVHRSNCGARSWGVPAWVSPHTLMLCTRSSEVVFWSWQGQHYRRTIRNLAHSAGFGAIWAEGRGFAVLDVDKLHLYSWTLGSDLPLVQCPVRSVSLPPGCTWYGIELHFPRCLAVSYDGAHLLGSVRRPDRSHALLLVDWDSGCSVQHPISFAPEHVSWSPDATCAFAWSLRGYEHALVRLIG